MDILAEETGWTVRNLGENGREIPTSVPDFPADTDLLIIMLGTNDLLQAEVRNRPLNGWIGSSLASPWIEARSW